jgi:hypothetical protein
MKLLPRLACAFVLLATATGVFAATTPPPAQSPAPSGSRAARMSCPFRIEVRRLHQRSCRRAQAFRRRKESHRQLLSGRRRAAPNHPQQRFDFAPRSGPAGLRSPRRPQRTRPSSAKRRRARWARIAARPTSPRWPASNSRRRPPPAFSRRKPACSPDCPWPSRSSASRTPRWS